MQASVAIILHLVFNKDSKKSERNKNSAVMLTDTGKPRATFSLSAPQGMGNFLLDYYCSKDAKNEKFHTITDNIADVGFNELCQF
jgi:hypothetical protein